MIGPFPGWVRRQACPGVTLAGIPPRELFIEALCQSDDTYAVNLIESGHVRVNDRVGCGKIFRTSRAEFENVPLLFFAIYSGRSAVVKALVSSGANPDTLIYMKLHPGQLHESEGKFNAAGACIIFPTAGVPMLKLVRSLGANLSTVYIPQLTRQPMSALLLSITRLNSICLKYILEEHNLGKPPVHFDADIYNAISAITLMGDISLEILKLLYVKEAIDFKILEKQDHSAYQCLLQVARQRTPSKRVSAADELLSNAKKCGGAALVQFLVKEVGLVSCSENM